MFNEAINKSNLKWRENNRKKYLNYVNDYYKKYYETNKKKENNRLRNYRLYQKETLRMRNILLFWLGAEDI
jgi:hypothetical protein